MLLGALKQAHFRSTALPVLWRRERGRPDWGKPATPPQSPAPSLMWMWKNPNAAGRQSPVSCCKRQRRVKRGSSAPPPSPIYQRSSSCRHSNQQDEVPKTCTLKEGAKAQGPSGKKKACGCANTCQNAPSRTL